MAIGGTAQPKPAKGTALIERRQRRKAVAAFEEAEKDKVRRRDRMCRWPHCANCKAFKPRLEVAHANGAKGMGGDHGARSTADQMMLLDYLTHQGGTSSLEQGGRRIVALTDQGTNGPCEFWADSKDGWYLVARERAPFVYERD